MQTFLWYIEISFISIFVYLFVVPSAPYEVIVDNIRTTSMIVSWQTPHEANGITGYQVSYTSHGESECILDVAVGITSTELTSLVPHTEYTIRVRAKTVAFGEYSIPTTAKTRVDGE